MKKSFLNSMQWSLKDTIFFVLCVLGILGVPVLIKALSISWSWLNWILIDISNGSILFDVIVLWILITVIRLGRRLSELDLRNSEILSDESLVFISSSYTNLNVRSGTHAVQAWKHPNVTRWEPTYPALNKSKWMAHAEFITEDEAINGGTYRFQLTFKNPCPHAAIRSALLMLAVDDECEVIVNGKSAGPNALGYEHATEFELANYLQDDSNEVIFIVHNVSFVDQLNPARNPAFASSDKKWEHNPYGFKFRILIQYLK
jgi:hypothetical protein